VGASKMVLRLNKQVQTLMSERASLSSGLSRRAIGEVFAACAHCR